MTYCEFSVVTLKTVSCFIKTIDVSLQKLGVEA